MNNAEINSKDKEGDTYWILPEDDDGQNCRDWSQNIIGEFYILFWWEELPPVQGRPHWPKSDNVCSPTCHG